ncbi:hypothetical protein Leryth_021696 [Lithospermum erythrorhizon]|nr:hypothetical protein Leryth_021696 [Lithospermum erythrorhizon]
MSKQAQLPPRYPFQKKVVARPEEPVPATTQSILQPRHCKSVSQSFIGEECPLWFDDLLTDSDSYGSGAVHRRSASDSFTYLDSHEKLPGLSGLSTPGTSVSSETEGGLESSCSYGPNSPRGKGQLTFPDNAVVSALSEFVSQAPLKYFDHSLNASEIVQQDSLGNSCKAPDQPHHHMIPAQGPNICMHQGKWSRVRKVQHIAELERTVSILQGIGAELAVNVSALHQKRATLSVENNFLKQQIIRLQQEKLRADGEYQYLAAEVERLKASLGFRNKGMGSNLFEPVSTAATLAGREVSWEMLDMRKLDFGCDR